MAKEFKMSQARYDELKQELDYSKTTRADEVAELIKEARGFGDLSENSEYDEAKNEQGKLYSRIAELEDILLHAVIVDETEESDKITIGSVVTVTELAGGKQLPVYRIVGLPGGGRHVRAVSEDSPFGKALMGHKAGEEVAVEAPPRRDPLPHRQDRTLNAGRTVRPHWQYTKEGCKMADETNRNETQQQDLGELLRIRREAQGPAG